MNKQILRFAAFLASVFFLSPAFAQTATLMINEVNPNITGSTDLVELLVLNGGSVGGFTLQQAVATPVVLDTLPVVTVSTGDIIVIHLNPTAATGAAPASETSGIAQFTTAMYAANYDGAWDFHAGATGLTYSNRVLMIKDPLGTIQDAVAFTNNGGVPAAFPADLQAIQAQGLWKPDSCSGAVCDYFSTPTAEAISVVWQGSSTVKTGNSVQRLSNADTDMASDWSGAPVASTWGVLNAGQSPITSAKDVSPSGEFGSLTNFPNPFSANTTISFALPKAAFVSMQVVNMLGDVVAVLLSEKLSAGNHRIDWSAEGLSPGIYFCELKAGSFAQTKKLIFSGSR